MAREKSNKQLIELNDELENYFHNTIIPQIFVDANLILRKFTPPAMKQFDLSNSDIGKSIIDVQDNFRFHLLIESIQYVLDRNKILEKEIQTTDLRWYQMNILPYVRKQDNVINGVIITFVDITRRIQDLKNQEKLISDLETLLDTISHDIKNPLNNLSMGMSQLKKTDFSNREAIMSLIAMVDVALGTIRKVITDLIDSRKREFENREHYELVNIEHILEDVDLALKEEITATGTIIHKDIQISQINFSRRKLRSIIYNILSNSIKYRSPLRPPKIYIKVSRENDHMMISIKDNGIGIEPRDQSAVFAKYFRVNENTEGHGIGLFLVQELVHKSGGKVQIESQVNKGTEIRVFLKDQ